MPSAALLPASLAIPRPSDRSLSFCKALTAPNLFRPFSIFSSSFTASADLPSPASIRMGGGPRTYPGGVSKWQWKRMQANKAKQLLKARLCRERQLYEMRKRAELKAAISELERPWEAVESAPALFSVSADEQVKALADRFQRPTGFDMWTERDGPRLFRSPDDLPSARFFPKGAVHSVKPYGVVAGEIADGGEEGEKVMRYDDWIARGAGGIRRGRRETESERSVPAEEEDRDGEGNRGSYHSDSDLVVDGSRMNGDFGRRGGRRRNWDGSRRDFGKREMAVGGGGGRGRNRDSYRSYSELDKDDNGGGFSKRGGRGENRSSYGSESEVAMVDWRKGRAEMGRGRGRDYAYGGRVSLRPTTELRLERGGDVRREGK